MLGVLLFPLTVLLKLQPLFNILLVLGRSIIFSFTLRTNQRKYLLHNATFSLKYYLENFLTPTLETSRKFESFSKLLALFREFLFEYMSFANLLLFAIVFPYKTHKPSLPRLTG